MIPNIFWIEHKILKNSYGVLACVLVRARETGKEARGIPLGVRKVDTNGKECLGSVVVGEEWSGLRAGLIRRRALWAFCLSAELDSVGKKGRGGPITKKPGGETEQCCV